MKKVSPLLPLFLLLALSPAGCGYRFYEPGASRGYEGVRKLSVPIFRNETSEPELETIFTSSFLNEVEKGGAFILSESNDADAIFTGVIREVKVTPLSLEVTEEGSRVTLFRLRVTFDGCLRRVVEGSNGEVLWRMDDMTEETEYSGMDFQSMEGALARKGLQISAFHQIARDLMEDVYDLMIKGF